MFIIKFNNMIRNKWLWGAFAIIVAGAFIMSDSMVAANSNANGAGKLNGEAVDFQEFNSVRDIVILNRKFGRDFANIDCSENKKVWLMLAALRTADELKITVSDDQVIAAIKNDPAFMNSEGQFDLQRAKDIIERFAGLSMKGYEEFLRTNFKLEQLRSHVAGSVVVPQSELKLGVDAITDVFTFTPAIYSNTVVASEIKIDEQALVNFYNTNTNRYVKPARVSVRHVAFEASKYFDASNVQDEEIREYYESNIEKFTIEGKDGAEDTYKPLEEVKEQIVNELAREKSEEIAGNEAWEFHDSLVNNPKLTMEALAAEKGYTVVTTALFSAESPIVIQNSKEYIAKAFSLIEPTLQDNEVKPYDYADEVVVGGAQNFVIAYNSHELPVVAPLEEVRAQVLRDAQNNEKVKEFDAVFSKVKKEINEIGVTGDATFESIVEKFGLVAGTNITASVLNININGTEEEKKLVSIASSLDNGTSIPEPVNLSDESFTIIKIIDRVPGDVSEKASVEPFISMTLKNEIASRIWANWLEENLASMDFQTTMSLEDTAEAAE